MSYGYHDPYYSGNSGKSSKGRWSDDDFYGSSTFFRGASKYTYTREKTNIVDPELSYWEASTLHESIRSEITKSGEGHISSLYEQGIVPKDVVEDIYKSYYYTPDGMALINLDKPELAWKAKLLDKLSSYYLKPITRSNELYSTIVTKTIVHNLLRLIYQKAKEQGIDPDTKEGREKMKQMCQQMGDGQDGQLEKMVEKVAAESTEDLSKVKAAAEEMFGKEAAKNLESRELLKDIDTLKAFAKEFSINPAALSKFVKGCEKNIVSYFNANSDIYEEPFLEADEVHDIQELEQLLPILRYTGLEDMVVDAIKSSFKFDIYLDASGSMSDGIRLSGGGSRTRYQLGIYLTIRLNALGLVKKMFLFDNTVRHIKTSMDLYKAHWGGGTSFSSVLNSIRRENRPSVVLTDMQDTISSYVKSTYFVGLGEFHPSGTQAIMESYQKNKQFLLFDSKGFKVPIKGTDY